MKSLLYKMKSMSRDEALLMIIILIASLVGLAGTAVFLNWFIPVNGHMASYQPFLLSLGGTLIYSGVIGGILYLLHPQKGLVFTLISNR